VISFAQYRIPADRIDDFLPVLDQHWTLLRDLELVTDRPPQVYAGTDKAGGGLVVELFQWVDADASDRAHTHPDVSAVWESMGPYAEERDGRPPFEFTNLQQVR
jgi:hypothetical protein